MVVLSHIRKMKTLYLVAAAISVVQRAVLLSPWNDFILPKENGGFVAQSAQFPIDSMDVL